MFVHSWRYTRYLYSGGNRDSRCPRADRSASAGLRNVHQFFIVYFQHVDTGSVFPEIHEVVVLSIMCAQRFQVIGEIIATGKELEITGQAGIKRMASAWDDRRDWEGKSNQAKMHEIVRHLVSDKSAFG